MSENTSTDPLIRIALGLAPLPPGQLTEPLRPRRLVRYAGTWVDARLLRGPYKKRVK